MGTHFDIDIFSLFDDLGRYRCNVRLVGTKFLAIGVFEAYLKRIRNDGFPNNDRIFHKRFTDYFDEESP